MFFSSGKLEIDNGLRIICEDDFIRYYRWIIEKYFFNIHKFQLPTHRAHITLLNPKIHKNFTYTPVIPYIQKTVDFSYDPTTIYESKVNFWLPVKCDFAENLKKQCGVYEGAGYYGLHLTICNKKFNNQFV